MFVLPIGVEAKTTGTPWATLTIVVVVSFYSILNWTAGQRLTEFYIHSPEHRGYLKELKAFVGTRCGGEKLGDKYHRLVLPEHFLRLEIFEKLHGKTLGAEFVACAKPFFDERNVKTWGDSTLAAIYDIYTRRKIQILKADSLLSFDNISFQSVLRAQFLHGGFMHLFGNLIFLLLLAFPVEQRLGSGLFALTYLLSGTFGMILSALASPDALYTVGASANIFGIAGAFMVLFYRHRMRVFVSFFFVNHRIVLIPVSLYFGFWFVAEESFSILKQQQDGIAHAAHLAGLVAGAVIAVLLNRLKPLPAGLTYPYELDLQNQLSEATETKKRLKIYNYWMHLNPGHRQIQIEALKLAEEDLSGENQYGAHFLRKNALMILQRHLADPEVVDAMPIEGLNIPARAIPPRSLKKALDGFLQGGHTLAEWKILFALVEGQEDTPLEWVHRLEELTHELSNRRELMGHFQQWAQRSEALRSLLPEQREKRIVNVG